MYFYLPEVKDRTLEEIDEMVSPTHAISVDPKIHEKKIKSFTNLSLFFFAVR